MQVRPKERGSMLITSPAMASAASGKYTRKFRGVFMVELDSSHVSGKAWSRTHKTEARGTALE